MEWQTLSRMKRTSRRSSGTTGQSLVPLNLPRVKIPDESPSNCCPKDPFIPSTWMTSLDIFACDARGRCWLPSVVRWVAVYSGDTGDTAYRYISFAYSESWVYCRHVDPLSPASCLDLISSPRPQQSAWDEHQGMTAPSVVLSKRYDGNQRPHGAAVQRGKGRT